MIKKRFACTPLIITRPQPTKAEPREGDNQGRNLRVRLVPVCGHCVDAYARARSRAFSPNRECIRKAINEVQMHKQTRPHAHRFNYTNSRESKLEFATTLDAP